MGNQLAHESGSGRPPRAFGRTGALGLTKAELDRRCKPSGLYPTCHWDEKAVRRLIGDGRLASRLKGNESRTRPSDRECPICFLNYSEINITQCCRANICTECFLQIRPQKEKNCVCPFCNNNRLFVSIAHKMNNQQLEVRQAEEQRVIEARILARATQQVGEDNGVSSTEPSGFGSSLENDSRTRRAQSSSEDNDNGGGVAGPLPGGRVPENDIQLLRQLSLTSQDRQALEQEMRQQHTHPLALQLEAEAEERRIQNQLEYQRTHPVRPPYFPSRGLSRMTSEPALRLSGRRNWNEIVNNFERGGHGEVNSLDDLVVLEAAILLSMEEEERRRTEQSDSAPFNASQHASQGFPLVHERLQNNALNRADSLSSIGSIGQRLRRGRMSNSTPSGQNVGAVMESANLLLRGVTEDEQVAMAIALSMQEDKEEDNNEENSGGNGSGSDNNNVSDTRDEAARGVATIEEDNEAVSPATAGVASLPQDAANAAAGMTSAVAALPKVEPATPFASLPPKSDDEDDDDDDDEGLLASILERSKPTFFIKKGAKTTGDDVIEKDLPEVQSDEITIPFEQAVVVVSEGKSES